VDAALKTPNTSRKNWPPGRPFEVTQWPDEPNKEITHHWTVFWTHCSTQPRIRSADRSWEAPPKPDQPGVHEKRGERGCHGEACQSRKSKAILRPIKLGRRSGANRVMRGTPHAAVEEGTSKQKVLISVFKAAKTGEGQQLHLGNVPRHYYGFHDPFFQVGLNSDSFPRALDSPNKQKT